MKIILSGYGKMGKMLEEQAELRGHEIVARIDIDNVETFASLPKADVVLDFSHPGMLPSLAGYIRRTGTALCSGTTAFGEQERQTLAELAEYAPVLHSANYSLGIAVFRKMLEQFAPCCGKASMWKWWRSIIIRKSMRPAGRQNCWCRLSILRGSGKS